MSDGTLTILVSLIAPLFILDVCPLLILLIFSIPMSRGA